MGKTFFSLMASFFVCSAPFCHGQPVTFTSKSLMTVGGISYLRTTATVAGCDSTYGLPVTRSQNLLRLLVLQASDPNCIPLEGNTWVETNTFVLGPLESGEYLLEIADYFLPQIRSWSFLSITNDNLQTITLHPRTNLSSISFDVAGVSGVKYIIQTSTDLVEWNNLHTNVGAPFTYSAPAQGTESNRYYRAKIISLSEIPFGP